jgi:hypothetical protein
MGSTLSARLSALVLVAASIFACKAFAFAFESVDIEIPAPAAESSAADAGSAPASGAVAPAAEGDATTGQDGTADEEAAPPPGPTIMFRGEVTDGSMSPTFNLMSRDIILWGLYPNTNYADYEIGKTVWEKKTKNGYYSLVGYAAVWPHQHKYFALPWFYSTIADGKTLYTINLAEYVPLNDGPWTFVADGNSVMRRISKEASVGVDSLYFDRDGLPKTAMWGPAVSLGGASDHVSLYARALVFGQGEDTYRLDVYFH